MGYRVPAKVLDPHKSSASRRDTATNPLRLGETRLRKKLLCLEFATVIVGRNRDCVAVRISGNGELYKIAATLSGLFVVGNASVFDVVDRAVGAEVFVKLINTLDR